MEELNKNNNVLCLPLYSKKLPIVSKHFAMVSSSTLPLPNASHDVWKKPYLRNHGEAQSNETKPYLEEFNGESCPPPPDDKNMKTNIPSSPSNKNESNDIAIASVTSSGISIKTKPPIDPELKWDNINPNTDKKKLKRILSNRISAQKSRIKKIQYINDMERKAKDLQAEIAMLSPRISYQEHQIKLLRMEKDALQQKLDEWADRSNHSYWELVEHQAEVKRQKQYFLMMQQGTQKQEEAMRLGWKPAGLDQTAVPGLYQLAGPQPVAGMTPNQDGLDPFLNFNSLAIDPPKSLM